MTAHVRTPRAPRGARRNPRSPYWATVSTPTQETLCGEPITDRDWTLWDAARATDAEAEAFDLCTTCRQKARS